MHHRRFIKLKEKIAAEIQGELYELVQGYLLNDDGSLAYFSGTEAANITKQHPELQAIHLQDTFNVCIQHTSLQHEISNYNSEWFDHQISRDNNIHCMEQLTEESAHAFENRMKKNLPANAHLRLIK